MRFPTHTPMYRLYPLAGLRVGSSKAGGGSPLGNEWGDKGNRQDLRQESRS